MTETNTAILEEPTGPYPPRYWWLKRLSALSVIVVLLLAGARLWWGREAQKRLDAAFANLRSRGEPATADDLNGDPLKDADNAAYYLKLGASKINPNIDSPSSSNDTWKDEIFPYPKRWFKREEIAAPVDQSGFADLREARRHPRARWITAYTSPLANVLLPHLNWQRNLANHASDYAMFLHFQGNDAEAMEMIEDIYAEADAVDQESFLVSHLVSIGICALATDRLEKIAPELTVHGVSSTTNPTARPASREQVQRMIARLLDSKLRTESMPRAFANERLVQMDIILKTSEKVTLLRPMLQLDAAHTANEQNRLMNAAKASNWPAAEQAMKTIGSARSDNPARVLGQMINPSLDRAAQTNFRVEEGCKAAAVSLAFRLYRLDHGGAFPPNLEALAPKYLPMVPIDPMAAGNKPLGYTVVDNGKRPIVYSVGEDGKDDTAAGVPVPSWPYYGWNVSVKDQYLDLTRWMPPASATNPAGDSSDETPDN